jgi:hypothetical protein
MTHPDISATDEELQQYLGELRFEIERAASARDSWARSHQYRCGLAVQVIAELNRRAAKGLGIKAL